MMIEKIITKNNQDFQYFSESELTELRNESFVRSYKKGQVLFYWFQVSLKLKKMIAVVIFPICIL